MRGSVALAIAGLVLGAPAMAGAADDRFIEHVRVLHEWHGEDGGYFGWAVSELGDVDGDGTGDFITSEPYAGGLSGVTWVYSGRTGKAIYRLPGQAGDFQGGAIADAGDTDGDGVHDIVSGASGATFAEPGRTYLYSGATGELLHAWQGAHTGDQLGYAVASAGDQDGDGRDDVLVGAPTEDGATGADAGAVYVFSGRTYEPLRRIEGGDEGDWFGSATDWTASLDADAKPDLLAGALAEGPGPASGGGGAHAFSGATGAELLAFPKPPGAAVFGNFFVAGVGRVDGDGVPDVYAADYAAGGGRGYAAVFSGADGSVIHEWSGAPGDGTGPGREARDIDRDGRTDIAVGSYRASDGAAGAGRVDVFSGRTGTLLRRVTSTTAGEQLGFDALGIPDVNGDHRPDLLLSAAEGDTLYLVAGEPPRGRRAG
jgi:hypothetical protein